MIKCLLRRENCSKMCLHEELNDCYKNDIVLRSMFSYLDSIQRGDEIHSFNLQIQLQ